MSDPTEPVTILGTLGDDFFHTFRMGYDDLTEFYIEGDNGNDIIRTGNGSSEVIGGKGDDRIYTGGGNDTISAGNHNDYVNAGRGDDYVSGGAGDDNLIAGKGDDVIYGGSGNDIISGVKGYNYLDGGAGDDRIKTGIHTSTAVGGDGEDVFIAHLNKGADHTLTGGADADLFVFKSQDAGRVSDVTITDFELGVDRFIVSGVRHDDFLIDATTVTEVDGNAVLDIGDMDTITFEGVSADELIAQYDDGIIV